MLSCFIVGHVRNINFYFLYPNFPRKLDIKIYIPQYHNLQKILTHFTSKPFMY